MHNFKNFKIWQKSADMAVKDYQITSEFPSSDRFGMTSQMKRLGISIPLNIAKGYAKTSGKSFINSLEISLGEIFELEAQMIISERVGILDSESAREMEEDLMVVQRMIVTLRTSMEAKS